MSKPEHSPLPWHVEVMPASIWFGTSRPDGKSFEHIVGRFDYGEDFTDEANARYKGNAQFIVTACNSYYDNKAAIAELEKGIIDVAASLVAAVSLLERGGKKAAPSNKMFDQMIVDYKNSVERARAIIAKHRAGKP